MQNCFDGNPGADQSPGQVAAIAKGVLGSVKHFLAVEDISLQPKELRNTAQMCSQSVHCHQCLFRDQRRGNGLQASHLT